jgi:hypothetical protein
MIDEEDRQLIAANDNAGAEALRIDAAVLKIVRVIGRQIACEEFAKHMAQPANDNAPRRG